MGVAMALNGVLPEVGDVVLLGPSAGVQFSADPYPTWFRVTVVELALTEGNVYLTGWHATDDRNGISPPRRVFCRVAGLVIRRGDEADVL
jgi:hypothetical protein